MVSTPGIPSLAFILQVTGAQKDDIYLAKR